MQPRKPNLQMSAKSGGGEILIYDDIGPSWAGMIGAEWFAEQLKAIEQQAGHLDTLDVRINSYGGDVFEGLGIYNTLKNHRAKVTMRVDGIAASIASVIMMAGDTIKVAENAMVMIHNPATFAWGEAKDLREQADILDKIRLQIINTYAARTKQGTDDVGAWMDAATWLDASEAKARGFADEVISNKSPDKGTPGEGGTMRAAAERLTMQRGLLVARWNERVKALAPRFDPLAAERAILSQIGK